MRTLHVSAGGCGTRIADYIATEALDCPKHLLPIPLEGRTILGEIVRTAQDYFSKVCIWANQENHTQIGQALSAHTSVDINVDTHMSGPLGPMVRNVLVTRRRTYGCAGDYYCNFDWREFEQFHSTHGRPISILVSRSLPIKGARFTISKESVITDWERVSATTNNDRINIGCYIVEPAKELLSQLRSLTKHKEDVLFDQFVRQGLITAYEPREPGYNINEETVYKQLLVDLRERGAS